jgi:hypothetical protein
LAGGLCVVLALSGAALVVAAPASAAACDPENLNTRADIDGDGAADAVIGMPSYGPASGAVDIRGTGSPAVLLTAGDLGAGTGDGDVFGSSIAMADLDQDGCADLVIAAPAEGQSSGTDGEGGLEGQVHLVFGQAGGVDTSSSIVVPHDSSQGDRFGTALALVSRYDETAGKYLNDLYVGAPGATVAGHAQAGEVFRYTIAPSPVGRVTLTLREVRSQDSAGVPGSAETGDAFGSVLAATGRGGVLVGAPDEKVGSVQGAGAVWFLRVNAAGTPITSQSWSQNSTGVAGTAETDDRFGSVLGSRGSVAVVGVPDEDSGSHTDTGMIQTFDQASGTDLFSPGRSISQDSAGIPGKKETGDRFGAAIAVGVWLLCQESIDVAVGAPGEDVGTRPDAGTVTLITLDGGAQCPATTVRQGSGLAGALEAGDEVGSVLGLTRADIDLEEDYADRLLIGVPKEDIGAKTDAGSVQSVTDGIWADGVAYSSLKFSKGYLLTNHYGTVLSTPAG